MRRTIKRIAALILILVCICAGLVACNGKKGEIVSVTITEGILKKTYDVDEVLPLDSLSVQVTYKNGDVEEVAQNIKVVGFDTATTGNKKMTITYLDAYSVEYEYDVVYSAMPSQSIETRARIAVSQRAYPTGVSREVTVRKGELETVEALYFTVSSSESLKERRKQPDSDEYDVITKYEVEPLIGGWNYRVSEINDKSFKMVVYRVGGELIDRDKSVIAINFFAMNGSFSMQIKDVVITDGSKDLVLPNTSVI